MRAKKQSNPRLLAGVVGNVLEWYDFALYGYLVPVISRLFFPNESTVASLLATYGVFAAGLLMRPIGAIAFGHIGDRYGRRQALFLSIMLMAIPTVLIGCLPTRASVGVAAAILLTLLRLVQGLSVGGEFTTSVTYVVETSPADRRGLAGSWANIGSVAGSLLGVSVAAALTAALSRAVIEAWAWRIPFVLGGGLGIFGLWLRRRLPESALFEQQAADRGDQLPLRAVFTRNRRETLQAVLFTAGYGVFFFIPIIYLPTHVHEFADMDMGQALLINALGTAALIPFIPLAGYVSDRFIRRKTLLMIAFVAMAASAYPLFGLLNQGHTLPVLGAQLAFALIVSITLGCAPAMLTELFSTENRVSAYSLAYNIGLGICGGTAPIVAVWLVKVFDNQQAPAWYLSAACIISVLALWTMRDRSREPLR